VSRAQVMPVILTASLTRLPARCYKRVLCAEVCSPIEGLYADAKVSDAAKSALLFILICLAVEACSERVGNSGGGRTRGGWNRPAGG